MDFDPDDPTTWPADAESWYKVSYTTVTISTRQVPFPPEEYYAIFGSVFNRDPHNLSLYNADSADVSDLLASLPHNGNSLARLRLILPALGASFGLITQ